MRLPWAKKGLSLIMAASILAVVSGWCPDALAGETDLRPAGSSESAAAPESAVPQLQTEQPVALAVPEQAAQSVTPADVKQGGPEPGIILNFKDAPLDTILEYLSEVAGLVVVRETAVEGRITVISRKPIAADEAVSLLNSALKEKGYAAISQGRILKIVPLADAKKLNIPVHSGNDPAAIEPSDRVVTQIIPIWHVDAVKLKQDIAPLISTYAELAANASSNSLILTDTEANIRRFVEIVRAIDDSMSAVTEVRVFQLKYANATNAAQLINNLFKIDATTQSQGIAGGLGRFFAGRGAPPGAAAQPSAGNEATGQGRGGLKVTAAADDRTNTLVVSAPPDVLKVIESVVKELDSSTNETQAVVVYHLNNANAANMQTVLNNLFGVQVSSAGGGATATRTGSASSTAAANRQRSSTQPGVNPAASSSGNTPDSLTGQVYVIADPDTNSLMVMTASKNFSRVKEIIAQLDQPVPQVLIKVLIAEVTLDKSFDLGTEFSALDLNAAGHGTTAATSFNLSNMGAGITIGLLQKDITVTLAALQKVGKLDVLSRPYILGSDNQESKITVGQEVPFITNTRETDTGQTINTIQYQDIGIILDVTPHINPEGLVTMDISQEISTLTGTTVPISETVSAPVFAKRSATSRVAIQDGQTIVIGGLMQDQKTDDIKKVPLLGDIPLVGSLFRRKTTENTKTELLIFLTPQVATRQETLKKISAGELENNIIINNAVAPGTFGEYLKNMEQKEPLKPSGKQ